jgi:hypothetical protein
MSERDTDIEFDFFEDLEPPEADEEERRPRLRRPGPPGPRRPGHGAAGFAPLLRLAGLILFAIVVIVLLVFWVQSCNGASKRSAYKHYMEHVQAVASESDADGRALNRALTTPGLKASDLANRLDALAQHEELVVNDAVQISPPAPLRGEQQSMVEALQFRVSGLRRLADAFRRAAGSKDVAGGGVLLATQAQRLATSDVVWEDLFRSASVTVLKNESVTGVAPPASAVVPNPDFASPRFWSAILARFQGVTTSGTTTGLHGTMLVSVKALSGTKQETLNTDAENLVTAGTDLAFAVTVEDSGDSQEVQVKVTLTIAQQPVPIVKSQTIDLINAGEQKQVLFHNFRNVTFATRTQVKVDIAPVPGEHNTSNNSGVYPVIFSLT